VDSEQATESPRRTRGVIATVLVGILLFVLAYNAVQIHAVAADVCLDLDAGGRAYFAVLVLPAFTITLWLAAGVPMVILGRRHRRLALAVAAVAVAFSLVWFVAGAPGYIRSVMSGGGYLGCPGGLPDGWPAWLDR
jgi:hypothetical protein